MTPVDQRVPTAGSGEAPITPAGRRWVVAVVIGWAGLLVASVALAARFMPVTNHAVLTIASLSPYLMGGAALSTAMFLVARRWRGAGVALVITAVAGSTQLPMFVGSGRPPADSVQVRVLTANLNEGSAEPRSLCDVARDNADILVFEELTPELADQLSSIGMDTVFPYRMIEPQPAAGGVGIWSRYPITRSDRMAGYRLGMVSAAVAVPGSDTAALFVATHLVGPWPQPIDGWRHEIGQLPETLQRLSADAGSGAVIVAGDFNATVDMKPFRRLLHNGFRDAAEQSGAGLVATYPADSAIPPLIGIDHILTLNSTARDARSVRIPGSDHLGVMANVDVLR